MWAWNKGSFAGVVFIVVIAGCNADSASMAPAINTASMTEITLPEVLRTARALDPSEVDLTVWVDDVEKRLTREPDDIWRGSVDVPLNQRSTVRVEWGTVHGTYGYLPLAAQQRSIYVTASQNSIDFANNYDQNFDADGDRRNNIDEIRQNRSPVDNLDVFIDGAGTIGIGGVEYPLAGQCGRQIPIAIQTRSTASDSEAWWCAKLMTELIDADGNVQQIENLEITVNVKDDAIRADSGTDAENISYDDDSIELFIDGNNNKGGEYDSLNDFQIFFAPYGDGVVTLEQGPNYPNLPEHLSGRTTVNEDGYVLTATIPLGGVGIRKGFPFGLNVEVNDDDNGGLRDGKYSWIGKEGNDNAWINTAAFGTSQVPR